MTEITKQLPIAPQKPIDTSGKNNTVKATIAAFKIIVNTPSVKNKSGNEKIVAIGFTTELTNEKTKPAATYNQKDERIPSAPSANWPNIFRQIYIATVDISHLITNVESCFLIITSNLF